MTSGVAHPLARLFQLPHAHIAIASLRSLLLLTITSLYATHHLFYEQQLLRSTTAASHSSKHR